MAFEKNTLIVCETCNFSRDEEVRDGRKGGEILLEHIQKKMKDFPDDLDVEVRTVRCFMSCESHCNVMVRQKDKNIYVVGNMTPDEDGADTVLEYFEKFARAETGQVPFREWPQGVKGNFIMRGLREEETEIAEAE